MLNQFASAKKSFTAALNLWKYSLSLLTVTEISIQNACNYSIPELQPTPGSSIGIPGSETGPNPTPTQASFPTATPTKVPDYFIASLYPGFSISIPEGCSAYHSLKQAQSEGYQIDLVGRTTSQYIFRILYNSKFIEDANFNSTDDPQTIILNLVSNARTAKVEVLDNGTILGSIVPNIDMRIGGELSLSHGGYLRITEDNQEWVLYAGGYIINPDKSLTLQAFDGTGGVNFAAGTATYDFLKIFVDANYRIVIDAVRSDGGYDLLASSDNDSYLYYISVNPDQSKTPSYSSFSPSYYLYQQLYFITMSNLLLMQHQTAMTIIGNIGDNPVEWEWEY